jgi:hypothetical protein
MTSNNTQHTMTDEANTVREMAIACATARNVLPDEALVQSYLIARFLGHPETFDTMKRLLQTVLRRPIGLKRPYPVGEFRSAVEKLDRTGQPAQILEFRAPTKH